MSDVVRRAFLDSARIAVELIGQRDIGDRWNEPSALTDMTIGALASHLARAVLLVEWYLDMDEPEPPTVTAAEYFAGFDAPADLGSDRNVGVRARADEGAVAGWARVYLDVSRTFDRLTERLPGLPPDRRIMASGQALVIDEYLKTRLVELTLHLDDLARSTGRDAPPLSPAAGSQAIAVLVGTARVRHGDQAILRALARRELDTVNALRVL